MPERAVDCGAAILTFWLITGYSLCCIALTEYMLCILKIAHDFIALEVFCSAPSASHKSILHPYRIRKKGILTVILTKPLAFRSRCRNSIFKI
jgi:hypothetical protein